MKVGFISLGCSKNLIDTEVTIGKFKEHEYIITNNPQEAEIIVVNTCGFIESAKEEAINTILEMAQYKEKKCKYLIAMGCLVQRYYDELIKELPEVDLFIKLDEYDKLWEKIDKLITENQVTYSNKKVSKKIMEIEKLPMFDINEYLERTVTTGQNYAYLKIGEGCSNKCTYCAIPYIRGPFVSRKIEEIIEEAEKLAKYGIKEIILIAQDTSKYGIDIYGKKTLSELLKRLCKIDEIKWIRFLYCYPEGIDDELIQTVASNEKICKYFDIPIQHISNKILKLMNRNTSSEKIEELILKIRTSIPDAIIRTSLITGFPGETEEDFKKLEKFVQKIKFDKLGVFAYSKEDGTPAEKLPNQVPEKIKRARKDKIMKIQQKNSEEKLKEKIGKIYDVLIENKTFDNKFLVGRTQMDSPEIDGVVYINNDKSQNYIGNIVKCQITDVKQYDIFAKICD